MIQAHSKIINTFKINTFKHCNMRKNIRYRFFGFFFILCFTAGCLSGKGLQPGKEKAAPYQSHIELQHLKQPDIHKPHIILITIDTLRADHLSCYQYQGIKTSHIDHLAKEGTIFEHAYTSTPITLPAHASILTGLYPQAHGVYNNATYFLNPSTVTLPEVLKDDGYKTAAFVSAYVLHSRYGLNQGFQVYNDFLPMAKNGVKSLHNLYDERKAEQTTILALEWLSENRDKPCFLWIHYFEPHAPYLPPEEFKLAYISEPYDGEIAYVDHCIGLLIKGVRDMNIYDHTAFILTSDHGEGLGEHEEMTHGVFLYDSTLHVPLIIRLPGITNRSIPALCRNIDIFPTIMDYCGLPCPDNVQGMSLLPLMLGEKKDLGLEILIESRYASENFGWANLSGIRSKEWKYINAPTPELYHLTIDPTESNNVWKSLPEIARQQEQMWQRIYANIEGQKEFDSQAIPLTPQVREQMRSLGYVWSYSSADKQIDPKEMAPVLEKLDKGVIYYTMGKYDEAIRELTELLRLNPENAMAHFHLGRALFLKQNIAQAKVHFIKVTQLYPRHIDAYNYLGYIYSDLNDLKEAEKAFLQILELNPGFSDGHYNLGVLYYKQGDFQRSMEEFKQATQINPNHSEGFYNLGSLYLDMDMLEEAEECLRRAQALDTNHPYINNSLGKLYNKKMEYEKATEAFLAAIQIDPLYKEAHNNLASVYIQLKRYNDALTHLEEALFIDNNFSDALYNLGVVHRSLGDFVKALEYLRRAENTGFYGYELCFTMGDTYLRLVQYEQARLWLDKAVSINPGSWKAHFNFAAALSAGGYDIKGAIEAYEKVIDLQPEIVGTYVNLGTLYFQQGNLPQAVKLWMQALDFDSNNIEAQINLGAAYIQMGLYGFAVERYKHALQLQPENMSLYYNIALAYLHQNKKKEAIISLRRALRIDPGFEAGKKLLDLAEAWETK